MQHAQVAASQPGCFVTVVQRSLRKNRSMESRVGGGGSKLAKQRVALVLCIGMLSALVCWPLKRRRKKRRPNRKQPHSSSNLPRLCWPVSSLGHGRSCRRDGAWVSRNVSHSATVHELRRLHACLAGTSFVIHVAVMTQLGAASITASTTQSATASRASYPCKATLQAALQKVRCAPKQARDPPVDVLG
jgi:hypothetical protein